MIPSSIKLRKVPGASHVWTQSTNPSLQRLYCIHHPRCTSRDALKDKNMIVAKISKPKKRCVGK